MGGKELDRALIELCTAFNKYRVTNKTISKTTSLNDFCHCGLSAILLPERFPTSGNDIQVALLMTILVTNTKGVQNVTYIPLLLVSVQSVYRG
jgi:hypothetical protein